jgi:hypothetical protein
MQPVVAGLLAAALGLGCDAAAPEPTTPTWQRDVLPILRAHCFHCHGGGDACQRSDGGVERCRPAVSRWDVYDVAAFSGLGDFEALDLKSAKDLGELIAMSLDREGPLRMPPPPASPLSTRERSILRKWAADPRAVFSTSNRAPIARLVDKRIVDGRLRVLLDVTDDDGDQVLGRVTAEGEAPQLLLRAGRQETFFDGATAGTPIEVIVTDGWPRTEGGPVEARRFTF